MTAYYNEIDSNAAEWIRNLIADGHIAAGDVDERDIRDVRPDDLRGYTQCHFFAGIGGWPLALRLAGWPDDRPVWTGSCPCQPFSQAGAGLGFADERHLWPFWDWLITQRRPSIIFGEQVASKNVEPWIDLVFSDLEAAGYACGTNPFPSASVGAPHIRDRAYFVAYANDARSQRRQRVQERAAECIARARGVVGVVADSERGSAERQRLDLGSAAGGVRSSSRQQRFRDDAGNGIDTGRLANANGRQLDGVAVVRGAKCDGADAGRTQGSSEPESCSDIHELADAAGERRNWRQDSARPNGRAGIETGGCSVDEQPASGPTNGFWRAADWLLCRDGKWRPVEPGTFPLVDGLPAGMGKVSAGLRRLVELAGLDAASLKRAKVYRVGALRGYGNAINPRQACEFIAASMEALEEIA